MEGGGRIHSSTSNAWTSRSLETCAVARNVVISRENAIWCSESHKHLLWASLQRKIQMNRDSHRRELETRGFPRQRSSCSMNWLTSSLASPDQKLQLALLLFISKAASNHFNSRAIKQSILGGDIHSFKGAKTLARDDLNGRTKNEGKSCVKGCVQKLAFSDPGYWKTSKDAVVFGNILII